MSPIAPFKEPIRRVSLETTGPEYLAAIARTMNGTIPGSAIIRREGMPPDPRDSDLEVGFGKEDPSRPPLRDSERPPIPPGVAFWSTEDQSSRDPYVAYFRIANAAIPLKLTVSFESGTDIVVNLTNVPDEFPTTAPSAVGALPLSSVLLFLNYSVGSSRVTFGAQCERSRTSLANTSFILPYTAQNADPFAEKLVNLPLQLAVSFLRWNTRNLGSTNYSSIDFGARHI